MLTVTTAADTYDLVRLDAVRDALGITESGEDEQLARWISQAKVINLSGLTPKTTPITPSDGAISDDTFVDGVLGSAMRVKLTSTGTYSNTVMSVKMSAR